MKLKRCAFLFVIGIIMVLCCVCAAVDIFAGGDGNLYDISSAILFGVLGVLYLISYGLVSSHHASGKGFAMLSLALTAVWTGCNGLWLVYGSTDPALDKTPAGCQEYPV